MTPIPIFQPRRVAPDGVRVSRSPACIRASLAAVLALLVLTSPASGQSPEPAPGPEPVPGSPAAGSESQPGSTTQTTVAVTPAPANRERYRDGIVIWETPSDANVPFLLKFNINTQ